MSKKMTESSGNVFADLGYSPEEAAILEMRADLMAKLRGLDASPAHPVADPGIQIRKKESFEIESEIGL